MNDFYVYVLFRPWDMTPCYIGKGRGQRWLVHERSTSAYKNPRLIHILKKSGIKSFPKEKLAEGLSEKDAFRLEAYFIATIGRGTVGPLVNFTNGGEGTSGIVISDHRRAAIGAVHKGKKLSAAHLEAIAKASADRIWTVESRDKIRASKTGQRRDTSTIEKMRVATRQHMESSERREKIATANRNRVWTPEMRANHSRRMSEVWAKNHIEIRP